MTGMKTKNAKILQYYTRFWPPIFCIAFIIFLMVVEKLPTDHDPYTFDPQTIAFLIFFLFMGPYLVLVYWFLPPLIYPSIENNWIKRTLFYLFTSITIGLGPVILYWVYVDRSYTQYLQGSSKR